MSDVIFQLQFSDRSVEMLLNGDFENWTGPNLDNWTIITTGASTVTQEVSDLAPLTSGSSAAKFTYDATPGTARIRQSRTLLKKTWYYLKIWYKYESEIAGKEFRFTLNDTTATVFLQDNFIMSAGYNDINLPICTTWTYIEIKFITHADYSSYFFSAGTGSTITSAYIIIDDIEFRRDTLFCARKTVSYNSAQYIGIINNSSINISTNAAYKGEYETSGVSITIADPDKYYRSILDNFGTQRIIGNGAIARRDDGTKISDYVITDINYSPLEIAFSLGDGYAELQNNSLVPKITNDRFPDAPESSVGQSIPHFSGQFQVSGASAAGKKDYIVAWRTKDTAGTTDGRYIIGKSVQNIIVWSGTKDFQYVVDSNDVDRTTSCTLIVPTATDEYHYVDLHYSIADVEYLKVQFKYPNISAETLIEEIGEILFDKFEFDITDITGELGWSNRHYNADIPGAQNHTDPHFVVDSDITGIEILKSKICETFDLSYYITSNRKILFRIFDFVSIYLDSDRTELQPGISSAFIPFEDKEEYQELTNQINAEWGYTDGGNKKNYQFNNYESQKRWNTIRNEKIECPLFPVNVTFSNRMAFQTAELWMLEKFNTQKSVSFRVMPLSLQINDTQKLIDILTPLHIWKFKHDNFKDDDFHLMQIRRINMEFPGGTAMVDFVDISHIEEIDTECTVLLQSDDESGSKEFLDRGANSFCWFASTDVTHDNSYPLFGKSSIAFNGSSSDLTFNHNVRVGDFHIFENIGSLDIPSVQVSVWVRFNSSSNRERIVSSYDDAQNYWYLFKRTDDTIRIILEESNIIRLTMTSTSTVADGNWHHILFYRNSGDDKGLYIDGIQEDYDSTSLAYSIGAEITVGNNGNSGDYLDGNIQDLYFAANGILNEDRQTGWFELNPNVGLTDTLNVMPYGLMSNFFQKYWIDFE
jgi:hypothetical protein